MTTLNPANLPTSINTVEKMVVWGCQVLNNLAPNVTCVEVAGQNTRVITSASYFISDAPTPEWRHIARLSIPVGSGWQREAAKYWTFVGEIVTGSVPAEFLQN